MAYVLSSVSGNLISAASAGYAPTNSAEVSAIASAYQVVSATSTQLYAGTAYLTSVNEAPISAARAGNAANATLATSAYYDGTGRLISSLPDSAAVSAIASSYAESAASGKLDASESSNYYPTSNPSGFISSVDLSDYATTAYVDSSISGFAYESAVSAWTAKQDALTFGYDTADKINAINGSALAGEGGGLVTAIGTSESGITSINESGLIDTAALHSSDYSSLYVQEPLYISASGDSSYIGISGDIGGIDSATCSAIASSYAESAASSKLDSSASSSFYSIDNPSGFLTAAYTPTFGYNTADQISSIDGSALGGMDEAAVSSIASAYAESAISSVSGNYYTTANESGYALSSDVSATVDLVGTQSANWGGSALALSAGPGVKLEKIGDTLVASTDETLLWSGSEWASATPTISLSGSVSSYDRIGIYAGGYADTNQQDFKIIHLSAEDSSNGAALNIQGIAGDYTVVRFNVGIVFPSANGSALRFVGFRQYNVGTSVATATTPAKIRRIVGINRTAEA